MSTIVAYTVLALTAVAAIVLPRSVRRFTLAREPGRLRVDAFTLIGEIAILLDTLWGTLASLGLDWGRMNEFLLAISFVLGVPMYLLDVWLGYRVAIGLLGLVVFRWLMVGISWRGSLLLFLAFALLQSSKLRRWAQRADHRRLE